ncbi:MAG: Copper amine oxidase domain protein [Thermoanaerobacterales bacterium 50_218]|nr:MAG: Copper amine oxidase domain protein [Thermoanaerobacterales bacterium 50_218]
MKRMQSKPVSLFLVLVFIFTVVLPVSPSYASSSSKVLIYGSPYKCVCAGDEVEGSTVSVVYSSDFASVNGFSGTLGKLVIQLSLPDGVEFSSTPDSEDVGESGKFITYSSLSSGVSLITANSNYCEVETEATDWDTGSKVVFDFSQNDGLDIDDEFTGDVEVTVEVVCFDSDGAIVWTEDEEVTIATVSGKETSVTAGDPVRRTWGAERSLAKITLEEGQPGELKAGEKIYFKILTDDVSFSSDIGQVKTVRVTVSQEKVDDQTVCLKISQVSKGLPGKIEFTPKVDICPGVKGDIKIKVYSEDENSEVEETRLVVAKVVDETGIIEELEDNDTVVYAGTDKKKLKVSFKYWPEGDLITLTLNQGKFVDPLPKFDGSNSNVEIYNRGRSVYYVRDSNNGKPVKIKDIYIGCNNDVEAGDIILTVGGKHGTGEEIVIGRFAKPFTATAEKPEVRCGAYNQVAGDIVITEAGAGTISEAVYMELPPGIKFSGKPTVTVTEGDIDVSLSLKDKNILVLSVNEESSSASTIKISNVEYDIENLVLPGDIELSVYTESDDSLLFKVANATVIDDNAVKATFAVGDEGVYLVNGRTLVQVNLLCGILGLQKMWDATTRTAYFIKGNKVVAFPIGENKIVINGIEIPVDQGAKIINDYTCATLRGLQIAFGGELKWDNENKVATFIFPK